MSFKLTDLAVSLTSPAPTNCAACTACTCSYPTDATCSECGSSESASGGLEALRLQLHQALERPR